MVVGVRIAVSCLLAVGLAAVGWLAAGFAPQFIGLVYLAAVTPALVGIDLREHRLPNRLVLPGIGAGLLGCAGEWIAAGSPPLVPIIAALTYAGFLLILNLTGGMGMGDVKLAAVLGLASWNLEVAVFSPVIAFLVGGLVAVALLAMGQRGRRVAFGPYLLGGYWVAVGLLAAMRLLEAKTV